MQDKITLVTAFFDIGRGEFDTFKRGNDEYFEYFSFWARMHNDLIVYCSPKDKERVLEIREGFGRNNTKIIEIEDVFNADRELYKSIEKSCENTLTIDFRTRPDSPESWCVKYNYITTMKWWFVNHAIENKLASGIISWIDFGYNHLNDYYLRKEDFDFMWTHEFSNKIHLFLIHELDNLPIFEIVRRMNAYVQGSMMVAPDNLWIEFWKMVRDSMLILNKVGLMDDDQTLALMAYREKPDMFEFEIGPWMAHLSKWSDKQFVINDAEKRWERQRRQDVTEWHKKNISRYINKWQQILEQENEKM